MARVLLIALSLLLAVAGDARVVVVGVDGASWSRIDPMLAAGELPALAALAERGVTADLATVEPVISPVVWTSIATGRSPDAHGITHFYAQRTHIAVPTVWSRLAAAGLRVGVYDWLVGWPPAAYPGGFSIPGWLRLDESVHPPDVYARAGVAPYRYGMETTRTPEQFVDNCRRELAHKPDTFNALARAFDLDVGAVSFYSVDASSHRFWDDAFPEAFPSGVARPDPRHAGQIDDVYRGVDAGLATIAAALGPADHLLLASDHGFQADDEIGRRWEIDAAGWFERSGFDAARDGIEVRGGFVFVVVRVLPGDFATREATLERVTAQLGSARTLGGEPLLEVNVLDVAERPPGHERSLLDRLRQWRVRAFLWWMGVTFDDPAHAYAFGRLRDDVLLPLWPEGEIRLGDETVPLAGFAYPHEFSGTHHPTAVFLAAGPAIARRPERTALSVLDVAPLLLYLAGQPVPDDLEGQLRSDLLDPAWLAAHPVRRVPAEALPPLPEAPAAEEAADDAAILERLRSLGYAE
ncbi:MAG: alkaline phosphatase family protein [Myxococcota bacterium]